MVMFYNDYNDARVPLLGAKHSCDLEGRPGRECCEAAIAGSER